MYMTALINPGFGIRPRWMLSIRFRRFLLGALLSLAATITRAEVPSGSRAEAEAYFAKLSKTLNYSTPENIGQTTLTDLAAYMG